MKILNIKNMNIVIKIAYINFARTLDSGNGNHLSIPAVKASLHAKEATSAKEPAIMLTVSKVVVVDIVLKILEQFYLVYIHIQLIVN